jgi:hypothetical protein
VITAQVVQVVRYLAHMMVAALAALEVLPPKELTATTTAVAVAVLEATLVLAARVETRQTLPAQVQ